MAEKRVAKNKKTQDEKNQRHLEESQRMAEKRRKHSELISGLRNRYVREREQAYEENNDPKFHVGQKVLLNHMADGDGWHAPVRSNMNHTPFDGPVEVIVKRISLDTGWLSDKIDQMNDRDKFINIHSENQYSEFKGIVDHYIQFNNTWYKAVMHQYIIELENSPKQYWKYPFREFQLVAVKSEHGKALTKLYDLEVAAKEMKQAADKAREKYEKEKDKLQYLSA